MELSLQLKKRTSQFYLKITLPTRLNRSPVTLEWFTVAWALTTDYLLEEQERWHRITTLCTTRTSQLHSWSTELLLSCKSTHSLAVLDPSEFLSSSVVGMNQENHSSSSVIQVEPILHGRQLLWARITLTEKPFWRNGETYMNEGYLLIFCLDIPRTLSWRMLFTQRY